MSNFFSYAPKNGLLKYLITPGQATSENLADYLLFLEKHITTAIKAGVSVIQIREKLLEGKDLFAVAEFVRDLKTGCRVLINERFDVALASGIDGVHLTSTSVSSKKVRKQCPHGFLIGVSTHSSSEVEQAVADKADYAIFGPIFDTRSKRAYGPPQGLNKLREVCRRVNDFPVIAVGGITATLVGEIENAGAAGFAAIGMFGNYHGS